MKKIKKIIVFFSMILISICSCVMVNATTLKQLETPNVAKNEIITLSSETVAPQTEFYIILNLANIRYTKFKVDITNTNNLKIDEVTEKVSDFSTNDVLTSFIVDKNAITLEKLGIVYTSPKEETIVSFSLKITNLDETKEEIEEEISSVQLAISGLEESLKSLNEILNKIEDTNSELYESTQSSIKEAENEIVAKEQEKNKLEEKLNNFSAEIFEEIKLKVVKQEEEDESNVSDKKNPFGNENLIIDKDKEKEKEMDESMKKMKEQMSGLEKDLQSANNKITSLTQGETYKGSQNNYLKNLNIAGIELKNEFRKTTADYFGSLEDSNLENVTVNAIAEDSTAIVTVYGNTDLKEGRNKIIINVTADNGDVRIYRIYLTK